MTYKKGTRKAVQVYETAVWEPIPTKYNPDYGVVYGTDGVSYRIILPSRQPVGMEMVILEVVMSGEDAEQDYGSNAEENYYWKIVDGEEEETA